jgi:hypothetical protein
MKIARIFLESDLRQGFQGLHRVLTKVKVNPQNLNPENYYVFMNRACTKFKLISGHYLVYFNNGNRRIPLEAIQFLPKNFGGSETEMNEAIRKVLTRQLGK